MSLVDLGKQLLESAKLGQTEDVRLLMSNGAPFTTDWLGFSPLHLAAQNGHLDTAEALLRAGISRDARTKVDRTPLHVAAQEGHLDVVELLVSHGADVDAVDMLRMTPLHWAVERGHYHTASLLLSEKASPFIVNKFGKTALDIAEDNDDLDLSELLQKFISEFPSVKAENKPSDSKAFKALPKLAPKPSDPTPLSAIHILSGKTPLSQDSIADLQTATITNSAGNTASSSDSEEVDTPEPSCNTSTNVLATLAALAAATAPNASISSSDALHWLESHGIQMLPTDNSSIIASAVEGGQTVALTEAGKLALTFVKEHQNLNHSNSPLEDRSHSSDKFPTAAASSTSSQKVITILADQSQIPSIISSPQTPIVLLNGQSVTASVVDSSPAAKKVKLNSMKKKSTVVNGKMPLSQQSSEELITEKLKRELESVRRQAEIYKAQMLQKAHEAELYKRQLEEMRTPSRVKQ